MCKNNSRDSSKFKGCSPLQLISDLKGRYHAIGYYSYTEPLAPIKEYFRDVKERNFKT